MLLRANGLVPKRHIWTRHTWLILLLVAVLIMAMAVLLILFGHLSTSNSSSLSSNENIPEASLEKLPLSFEPNAGQTNPSVRFLTHAPGGVLFFKPSEIVFALQQALPREDEAARKDRASARNSPLPAPSEVHLQFLEANSALRIESAALLPGKVNYLLGNDPSKWRTNLPTYRTISYGGLYPGIDLTYSGEGARLEGTYTIAVGADPRLIHWHYQGAAQLSIDSYGNLDILIAGKSAIYLTEHTPVAWQDIGGRRIPIAVRYALTDDAVVSFVLGTYDTNQPLTIDPTLTYSSYLGGNGIDKSRALTVDYAGNAYLTGWTASTDFPTANPLQPFNGGNYDAFVSKLNASGTQLLYSTYLGGANDDFSNAITVDAKQQAIIAGDTESSDFPVAHAYQSTKHAARDAFTAKLSVDGSSLIYSTFFGGNNVDLCRGISIDNVLGVTYLVGYTYSTDLAMFNPTQDHNAGNADAFVTGFNWNGVSLSLFYSSYLGGAGYDAGLGINIDRAGYVYITGDTFSTDFPLRNAYQPALAGAGTDDAFVTKINPISAALSYSTYLGGDAGEYANGIAVDFSGNAYITGQTTSTNFPTAVPYQPTNHGKADAFVTKFDSTGTFLSYSTYLGGSNEDVSDGISVDGAGLAYVVGYTYSTDFPLADAIQPAQGGDYDAFATKFNDNGSSLIYSTYLGGTFDDLGRAIALDTHGNAYLTGDTQSFNFPTVAPFQPTKAAQFDAFVSKISSCPMPTAFPYPWGCPLSPTPTSAPSPPLGNLSYYVHATSTPNRTWTPSPTPTLWQGHWYEAGKQQANNARNGFGPFSGVTVLHFGKPWFELYEPGNPSKDLWGSKLTRICPDPMCPYFYVSSSDIEVIVTDYARGFAEEARRSPTLQFPRVVVAIGTSNFVDTEHPPVLTPDQFRVHGRHWGDLVNSLQVKLTSLQPEVTIQGATDIEISWSDADRALRWNQGFEEVTRGSLSYKPHYYYADNACTDCYDGPYPAGSPTPDPNRTQLAAGGFTWKVDEFVSTLSSANRASIPLPQVYFEGPAGVHANQPVQWQWLSNYAANHYICLPDYGLVSGNPGTITYGGVITDPRPTPTVLAPGQAWQELWKSLKSSDCTYPNSTPVPATFMQNVTTVIDYPPTPTPVP
jgi:hypothetical protein